MCVTHARVNKKRAHTGKHVDVISDSLLNAVQEDWAGAYAAVTRTP